MSDAAADAFEDAPCGYVMTSLDGTILRVNRTFETMTGHERDALVEERRLQELLPAGGRIYWETHVAPMLRMHGQANEIALDVVREDGTRLPALVNAVAGADEVRVSVFDATQRRSYEQELMRARRQEQDVALRLQRSLLEGELPEAPGLEIDVAYRSAEAGLEVGGDWYDAFWLRDGEAVALVVGDVVGRGIDAAATMGQLRSAVRALAATGLAPAPLLDALEAFSRRHDVGRMTTVVFCELDVRSGELRWACAGHPPPALAPPDGEPEFLMGGRSLPLDAHQPGAPAREEGVCRLAPGSLVVLYSDGLIERRGRPLQEGLDRLLAAVARHRAEPAGALTARLLHDLHDAEHRDDLCLLAVRLPRSLSRF